MLWVGDETMDAEGDSESAPENSFEDDNSDEQGHNVVGKSRFIATQSTVTVMKILCKTYSW
jgi:hypothetical protein